ncbi:unnamed protein product [Brassica oleracea var. botrytis]|uniref:Uncharacterized protein n=1 Tax=Brassica oleracea TaxID=3712 RepID=A0A3P6FGG2_BRAOL|nr:unnamed protein product [Brassica oleracea]
MADAAAPLRRRYGPQRRPSRYNLQNYEGNHPALGRIITDSTQRWLYPWEIIRILRYAEARDIDISSTKPRRGFPGLYVYNTLRYTDHRQWQNEGAAGLIAWQTRVVGNHTVLMGQSRGLQNYLYRKRIHRVHRRYLKK